MIDWTDEYRAARDEHERAWRTHNAPYFRLRYAVARAYVLWVRRWFR